MEYKLLAWGFTPSDLEEVQAHVPEAEVSPLTTSPEGALEGPLLVNAAKVDEFVQWAEERTLKDGIQPGPVLLHLPAGVPAPDEAWEYCDGMVSDDDWSRLETLLECPHVLDAESAAADVRAPFLGNLRRPVAGLRMAEIPFGDSEWDRPDSEIRQHLATCVTCRAAFNESIELRLALRRQLLRPAWQEWVTMVVQYAAIEQVAQEQRQQMVIAALLTALNRAQLRARAGRLRGEGEAVKADDIPDLLAQLQRGETFVRPHRELKLQLEERPQGISLLTMTALRGDFGSEVGNFRLELRRGEETLWGADSVEGKVSLPLTELERALTDGADQLVILTPPEEE
jgi:hypothetical protein